VNNSRELRSLAFEVTTPSAVRNAVPFEALLTEKISLVAGVRLRYFEVEPATPPERPPLLVLHQLLATAETLHELIWKLPGDRRIIALDILSAETGGHALDLRSRPLADLVAQFVQSIGLERPVVIGHSHGGTLALWLATMPEVGAKSLVLLCPAHPFQGYRSHVVAFYLTRWGRFLALSIPLAPRRAILWAYNQAAGSAARITLDHLKPHLRVLRNRNSLRRVLDILRTWETDMDGLRQAMTDQPVTQPTLLVWGDQDEIVPTSSYQGLERSLPSLEQVTLHGMGHLLPEEAPQECADLIKRWLVRLEAGRERPVPGQNPQHQPA